MWKYISGNGLFGFYSHCLGLGFVLLRYSGFALFIVGEDSMPKIKLRCLDVSPSGGKFTIGKLYVAAVIQKQGGGGTVYISDDEGRAGGRRYLLNSNKKLQSQGCEFQIIVGQ